MHMYTWVSTCVRACRLSVVAGSPELYPELVRLGGVPPILTLLGHDNGDIAAAAVELLREMTNADAAEDSVRAPSQPDHAAQDMRMPVTCSLIGVGGCDQQRGAILPSRCET